MNANHLPSTPSKRPSSRVAKAKETGKSTKVTTATEELGESDDGADDCGDDDDDDDMMFGGNHFPTIDELLAKDRADGYPCAIPTPRPTRRPRKTKTAAQRRNDASLDRFTDTFVHYMSAAIKVMESRSNKSPPSGSTNAGVTESRSIALENSMATLKNDKKSLIPLQRDTMKSKNTQFEEVKELLYQLLEQQNASEQNASSSKANQQNKRQKTK